LFALIGTTEVAPFQNLWGIQRVAHANGNGAAKGIEGRAVARF
jgi:hypothetical protein